MSFVLLGILNAQAAAAGGAGAYDLLETTILNTTSTSVFLTGLDSYSDYKHLQIRATYNNNITSNNEWSLRLNFSSDSHYSRFRLEGTPNTILTEESANANRIIFGKMAASDSNGSIVLDILDFNSSTKNKTIRAFFGHQGASSYITLASGTANDTSPLTTINFRTESGNWNVSTRFSVYGIKG